MSNATKLVMIVNEAHDAHCMFEERDDKILIAIEYGSGKCMSITLPKERFYHMLEEGGFEL